VASLPLTGYSNFFPQARQVRGRWPEGTFPMAGSLTQNPKSEASGWKQPGDLFFRAINFRKGFPNMR
jgi:hypothetical protein